MPAAGAGFRSSSRRVRSTDWPRAMPSTRAGCRHAGNPRRRCASPERRQGQPHLSAIIRCLGAPFDAHFFTYAALQRISLAPHADQALRVQVVRRPDRHRHTRPAGRHRRSQRLRQVERHRRGALGAGRVEGIGAARRVDAGRDLQRRRRAQAGGSRVGRTALRQRARVASAASGASTRRSRSSAC